MAQETKLSRGLAAGALSRYTAPINPYGDDAFQAAVLKGQDAGLIMLGTLIEMLELSNGNGNGRWKKVKQKAPPVLSIGGLASLVTSIFIILA